MGIEFLITSLIVVLIPGTGVVFTVSTGIIQGRRASVFAASMVLLYSTSMLYHALPTVRALADTLSLARSIRSGLSIRTARAN